MSIDILKTVVFIGENYGVGINPNWNYDENKFCGWNVDDTDGVSIDGVDYESFEDAFKVAAEYAAGVDPITAGLMLNGQMEDKDE